MLLHATIPSRVFYTSILYNLYPSHSCVKQWDRRGISYNGTLKYRMGKIIIMVFLDIPHVQSSECRVFTVQGWTLESVRYEEMCIDI